MQSYHEGGRSRGQSEAVLVLYDLADPEAWQRAGDELEAWGKERTSVHRLGCEHVIIEYRSGGLLDVSEPA